MAFVRLSFDLRVPDEVLEEYLDGTTWEGFRLTDAEGAREVCEILDAAENAADLMLRYAGDDPDAEVSW